MIRNTETPNVTQKSQGRASRDPENDQKSLDETKRTGRARRKRPLSASVTTPSPARLKVSKKENKVMILPIMYQPLTQQKILHLSAASESGLNRLRSANERGKECKS